MNDEPIEMTYASQLLAKIEAADIATIKQLAYWSGLHENTIRDYRDGRIKHFGSESRFWNAVLVGMNERTGGRPHPIVYEIVGLFLHSVPMTIVTSPVGEVLDGHSVGGACKRLGALARDVAAVAESIGEIYEDGRVDGADDPSIAEFVAKADQLIARVFGLKALIVKERSVAGSGGKAS